MIKEETMFFRTSDGAAIHYEDYGAGQPIVLIPGFLCTTRFFAALIPALSTAHRLILVDPRGQGYSSKILEGHTLTRHAQDLRELLDHLNVRDALIMGWSMGGQTVLEYDRLYQKHRVAALGIMDSLLKPLYPGPGMEALNLFFKTTYQGGYEAYCRDFAEKIWGGIDPGAATWTTDEFLKTPPWIASALYSDRAYRDGYDLLTRVSSPVLFMGADSQVIPNGKALASQVYPEHCNPAVAVKWHTFETGGHVFFAVNPEEFSQVVMEFLGS
jgi:pimeloyl-ACP methyl ester carboxylesterase